MPDISSAELKSFRKTLTRWREDVNDRADELEEQLKAMETKAGVKSSKSKKLKDDDKDKDDEKDDEDEEDDDDGPF